MNIPKTVLTILFLGLSFWGMGQNDTEFWFAAPEIAFGGGTSTNRDRPIYIRVATFNQAATITLNQPARPAFVPIVVNLAANSTYTYDLQTFIDVIETKPADQIKDFGLHLAATAPITAYYEVASAGNPDIFTLKGRNSLGTRFIIPAQSFFNNSSQFPTSSTDKLNSFVIVATSNNTTVTIKPSKAIVGHPANVPFTITLNAGQSYSATALSLLGSEHLGGSIVTSNKPVAVTTNDDSVVYDDGNSGPDLVGDQIIPSTVFGKEYIVTRGFFSPGGGQYDKVYIYADSNNTVLQINGVVVTTLQEGQSYLYSFGTEEAIYVTANRPLEVFQQSGYNQQPAGAIIPPIECTGSNEIVFTRSPVTGSQFGLIIFTRLGNEGSFAVNPADFTIPATDFLPVPSTGGQWLYARKGSMTGVSNNTAYRISNSEGLFHLGVLYGNTSSNARYGFYSNFASVNLGPDQTICPGDSILLDAGAGKDTYLWNTGATTHSIWVKNPGEYYVDVTDYLCQLSDTLVLSHYATAPINLGNDTSICTGTTITLDAGPGFTIYNWSNGGHNQTTTVGPGTYTVTASIEGGCNSTDGIVIGAHALPPVNPIKHN